VDYVINCLRSHKNEQPKNLRQYEEPADRVIKHKKTQHMYKSNLLAVNCRLRTKDLWVKDSLLEGRVTPGAKRSTQTGLDKAIKERGRALHS
jgi:hypothetical protein